jgi:hypothetical protein
MALLADSVQVKREVHEAAAKARKVGKEFGDKARVRTNLLIFQLTDNGTAGG